MQIARLTIENFRGIRQAELHFTGHTLFVGGNNVGKSTICEAIDLVLGPDRLSRSPPVEEYDFYNARYVAEDGVTPLVIRVEVVLIGLTEEIQRQCIPNLEFWKVDERRLLGEGEIDQADDPSVQQCLRLVALAQYSQEEDEFEATTVFARSDDDQPDAEPKRVPSRIKRSIGFLYLRALRTGSRALSLERGSLLDIILRMKGIHTGLWERIRTRLLRLDPPIDDDAQELAPILDEVEARLAEYVSTAGDQRATRLFVSQLTREHLRRTISFFLVGAQGEAPVPFQRVGTGMLNTLVLALLIFLAEAKRDNVIFAMEEPEIALPPHTQRRIATYLLTQTAQCFVTSHSPYVIELFQPSGILRLSRDTDGRLNGTAVTLPTTMRSTIYRSQLRQAIAETMLGVGVIVVEGVTEHIALTAAAATLASANAGLLPLDLAGVTIVDTRGDGNLAAFGAFFAQLGITPFAFFDRKNRTPAQIAALEGAFVIAQESGYVGCEALMVAETPLDCQWQLLENIRDEDVDGGFGIPAARPADDALRACTLKVLKGLKGEGGAGRLIEICGADQLPRTITDFLTEVFARFPRPERNDDSERVEESGTPPEPDE